MLTRNYNISQLILFGTPVTTTAIITNSTGSTMTLQPGRVLGRVEATTTNVYPQVSSATDGSQIPVGVLAQKVVIADGDSATVTFIRGGFVQLDDLFLGLGGSDTLNTAISDNSTFLGTIGDILAKCGVYFINANDQTYLDTQASA
ncbi:MAG: head decoration protein [Taibaiella sp.]|nr:head decoration protein [Taibaiella sp.]